MTRKDTTDTTYYAALEMAYADYVRHLDFLEWSEPRYKRADDAERARMKLVSAEYRERLLGKCELIAAMFGTHTYDVRCDLASLYERRNGND